MKIFHVPMAASLIVIAVDPSTAADTYSKSCAMPLGGWGTAKDGIGHLLPVLDIELRADGTIRFNDMKVSDARLRSYMFKASNIAPVPQAVLEVSPTASCARVKSVRAIMDAAPMCKGPHSRCSEGRDWRHWPTVGGP